MVKKHLYSNMYFSTNNQCQNLDNTFGSYGRQKIKIKLFLVKIQNCQKNETIIEKQAH